MVIVVTGPTATGKSEMGIYLAKKLNGEIINCDSTQVYKGMNICTNKIKNMNGVIHHLMDVKDLNEEYSVYDYQRDCRCLIEDIISRGKVPILVGGTGLYINASLYDYEFEDRIKKDYSDYSDDEVYDMLLKIDSNTKIHQNNRRRIINAINYYDVNGKPFSEKKESNTLLYDTIFIGLTTDRDTLYERINKRVDNMVEEGLIDEALKLYKSGIRSKAVMTPIGPKELFDFFDGKVSLDEAIDLIKRRSRRYAKRQYTWFNNKLNLKWFSVNYDDFSETCNESLDYIKNKSS